MATSTTPLSQDWRNWPIEKKRLLLERIHNRQAAMATVPHRRQAEFLSLDDAEVLYGGAVGGGKTEALLLWLLEGVQYDNFSGLFLRRTFSQLAGSPTSPIERSFKFFQPAGGKWNEQKKRWSWPNGAMIRFGHVQHENDKHNYDGPEFHRIAWDQVEQFTETQYTYIAFTRTRRTKNYPIPCGNRASANPVGGNWVKHRFISQEAIEALKQLTAYDPSPAEMIFDCPGTVGKFVPARIADNPSLEVDEYISQIRERVGGTLAAKLANGDWSAIEGAVVDAGDLRYYRTKHEIIMPSHLDGVVIDRRKMRRFATVDTAGTSKQKAAEARGKPPSWSVCAIWDYDRTLGLFLRHVWRDRVGWPDLKHSIASVLDEWGNPEVLVENAHHGQVLAAELPRSRLSSTATGGKRVSQSIDSAKYDRAVYSGLLAMISENRLYLPEIGSVPGAAAWMPEFESELLSWTGHPEETADQIDVCSHAARHVRKQTRSWGGVV